MFEMCTSTTGHFRLLMDDIARRLPLSGIGRPDWDLERLTAL
jgi:hypothetical protein